MLKARILSKQVLLILQMHVDMHTFPSMISFTYDTINLQSLLILDLDREKLSLLTAAIARANVKATFSSIVTPMRVVEQGVTCICSVSFTLSPQNAGAKLGRACN